MNKKMLIIGCVLLLCCCFSVLAFIGLAGNFEANGKCIYKGPLAMVTSGACTTADTGSTTNNTTTTTNNTNTNSTNSTPDTTTSKSRTYTGASYTLTYPDTFSVDDSDSARLFVYAANGLDNLNISKKVLTITTTQADCEGYANDSIDQLTDYAAELVDVQVTNIGGYNACRLDFTADYGTDSGRVNQTQYYIAVGSQTYFETITINSDSTSFDALNSIAKSISFN